MSFPTPLTPSHHSVAAAYSVPVLAATIAFVTYTSTSHAFDVAIIFSSLSLFQLLRQPLMFLPRALSATTDAQNALARLRKVFDAETADPADAIAVDREQEFAVDVKGATFEWEESGAPPDADARRKKGTKGAEGSAKAAAAPTTMANTPFRVREISMAVPRGTLVAVVGSVGRCVQGHLRA